MAIEVRIKRVLNRIVPVDRLSDECWKRCPQCEGYEVSDHGRVRVRARTTPTPSGPRSLPARDLRLTILGNGYAQVRLGKTKHLVHRLIALAFVKGDHDLVVNHKNGIRADNRADNLEWITQSANCRHGYTHLGRKPPALGKFDGDHPASKPITWNGKTKTASQWAAERGWSVTVIRNRLSNGWSIERALTQPLGQRT